MRVIGCVLIMLERTLRHVLMKTACRSVSWLCKGWPFRCSPQTAKRRTGSLMSPCASTIQLRLTEEVVAEVLISAMPACHGHLCVTSMQM